MISKFDKRRVIGRKIVAVNMNPFKVNLSHDEAEMLEYGDYKPSPGRQRAVTYDPVFVLDNGTQLHFVVCETEVGEYGIEPILVQAAKKGDQP